MATQSPKYKEAEAMLPEDMKDVFRRLVREYEYLTTLQFGRGYVAYKVLAELILAGWRPSVPAHETSKI